MNHAGLGGRSLIYPEGSEVQFGCIVKSVSTMTS